MPNEFIKNNLSNNLLNTIFTSSVPTFKWISGGIFKIMYKGIIKLSNDSLETEVLRHQA